MRDITLFLILILSVVGAFGQPTESTRQIVEDEPWVLKPKEPTEDERLREENIRWILEVGTRHWSENGDITSEESERLWSIFRTREGHERINAFGTITFIEEVGSWKDDLVQMLQSDDKSSVQAALNILLGKLRKGSENERLVLTNDDAIAFPIAELESIWTENPNIQNTLQRYNLELEEYRLSSETEMIEEPAVEVAEVIEEIAAPEPAIENLAEVVVAESIEEDVEQSSNWPAWQADRWLLLIGALVVVGGVFVLRSRK